MATITSVEFGKKNGNRVNIYLDGNFFMACFADIAVRSGLRAGIRISEQQVADLIFEEEKEKAWNKALGYISKFIKTEKEVKDYLKKKEFSSVSIFYAINKLKEYGYLNDQTFVESFVSCNQDNRGIIDIKNRLKLKGIKAENVNEIKIDDEIKTQTAIKLATKYMKNRSFCKENYYKLSNFLYGKGIEKEDIVSAVNFVFAENKIEIEE